MRPDWGEKVGTEARKTFAHYIADGFFARFLSGPNVLDIGYKGYIDDVHPILPHAIGVDLDYPGYDGRTLPFPDGSQDAVFASHTLEHITDYRAALAEWFRVLRVGGHLIVAVPHQFLYERKLQPPSRWNEDHKRFYTCASLLAEIEESLDPLSYRVRALEENDAGFEYDIPPDRHAGGCYEIVVVVQRIERPAYAAEVLNPAEQREDETHFMRRVRGAEKEPVLAIESAGGADRILVLKLDHRGDFLMARPGFETMRAQFPAAHITLACGPWNLAEAEAVGVFDRVIGFDFFPEVAGYVQRAYTADESAARFATLLAGEPFDLAVDMRVDEETRVLLTAVNAETRAGFGSFERFPFLDIALPLVNPTIETRAYRRLLKAEQFGTRVGRHEGFAITNERRRRRLAVGDNIIFGPYERFEAGAWELEVIVEPTHGGFELGYDVAVNSGNEILGFGTISVRSGAYPRVFLSLESAVEGLEFRLKVGQAGSVLPFRFFGCLATKRGSLSALHQEEMQAMLAYLVGLRMRHPTRLREIAA